MLHKLLIVAGESFLGPELLGVGGRRNKELAFALYSGIGERDRGMRVVEEQKGGQGHKPRKMGRKAEKNDNLGGTTS